MNIKILVDGVVAKGGLTTESRNLLLARMTDEVDKAKQRLRRAGENLKSSVVAHKKLEQNRLSKAKNDDAEDAEDEEADDDSDVQEEVK